MESPITRAVVVVGAGNAALCAAISAAQQGATVTVLERASAAESGGNSRFTAGAMRTVYGGVEDLLTLMPDLTPTELANTDFGRYPKEQFYADLGRVTQYRCDPELAETLIENSLPTLQWMQQLGVRFLPLYGRQSFSVDGQVRFWGGLTVEAWGGGHGLVESLTQSAQSLGVEVLYNARAKQLSRNPDGSLCVAVEHHGSSLSLSADAAVLACGGFESNAAWRARYLGSGWDLAKVRGTRFNTGDGLHMAINLGAAVRGHWSGCHAVQWDANAPEYGDLAVGDGFQKHSYPFGILVNRDGKRFLDEGADFRNYTYARYGAEVLQQPGQVAWQIFDAQADILLRDEYRIRQVSKVSAASLSELATKIDGMNETQLLATIGEFNAAIDDDIHFDPTRKDGRCTTGISPPKSNWARAISQGPFTAYQVTCGITFTFGGLHVDANAHVLDQSGMPIPGLYAAGEIVGGLFYFNYPGGTGLTSGAVFGKRAGLHAAGTPQHSA
ncbi:MAG: FAD-dependent tricarballylate dehydrogenase TcuA [Pseudomonadales bacterium]